MRRLIIWLSIDVVVAAIVLGLLFYKPSSYNPILPDDDETRVNRYITHLSSELYNNAQARGSFVLEVLEEGINLSIASWSADSEGIILSGPEVLFRPNSVFLMGTADIQGASFIVTVVLEPQLDSKGLLNLHVSRVSIGAMNITPLARIIAGRMYRDRLNTTPVDEHDLRTKIVESLLTDKPFEPVFWIDDKMVRLKGVVIEPGRVLLELSTIP